MMREPIRRIDFTRLIERGVTIKVPAPESDDVFAPEAAERLVGTYVLMYVGDVQARVRIVDAALENGGRAIRLALKGEGE